METGAVMGSVASPSADRMTRPLAVSLARGVDDVTGTRADLLAQLPLRERVWLPRGEAARYDPGTQLSRACSTWCRGLPTSASGRCIVSGKRK
jgi:hypothetical protein